MSGAQAGPERTRRRSVGPPGAVPPHGEPVLDPALWTSAEDADLPAPDDDERLLRDVPPHHGT